MLYSNKRHKAIFQKFVLIGLLNIFSFTDVINSAPLSDNQPFLNKTDFSLLHESISQTLASGKRFLDRSKNLSDIAWKVWDAEGTVDSSHTVRRISTKSIFIAPTLIKTCPNDYVLDERNECVKIFRIDEEEHLKFILQGLNDKYATINKHQTKPQPQKEQSSGPLQLNIPLIVDTSDNNDTIKPEKPIDEELDDSFLTFNTSVNVGYQGKPVILKDGELIVAVYEDEDSMGHETDMKQKHESILIGENSSTNSHNHNKNAFTDEFKDNSKDQLTQENYSNIASIENYNIPISLSQSLNRTEFIITNQDNHDNKEINSTGIADGNKASNESISKFTPLESLKPPEVLPINTRVNLTSINNFTDQAIEMNNSTNAFTIQENINTNYSEKTIISNPAIKIAPTDSESITTEHVNEATTPTIPTDFINEKDDTLETIEDWPVYFKKPETITDRLEDDFDSSTEQDEILKHSEAGMTVTMPAIHLKPSRYPPDGNKHNPNSNVSTVITINDDFIREITVLGLNLHKSANKSKDSIMNNSTTTAKPISEKKVIIVTPSSPTTMMENYSVKEITSKTDLNATNTESTKNLHETTTTISADEFETESSLPLKTQNDEISEIYSDTINPVVSIEEASMSDDLTNRKSLPLIIIPTDISIENKSQSNVSKTDENSQSGFQGNSPLTSLLQETQGLEYIRTSNASQNGNKNNHETSYSYDAISQPYSTSHVHQTNDNQPIIKIIDDEHLKPTKNHNPHHFFPDNSNTRDYVRFPTYKRPSVESELVRFPSDGANSIHAPGEPKQGFVHRPHNIQNNRATMVLSQPSNWHLPPNWRLQHQYQQQQQQQQRTPLEESNSNLNDKKSQDMSALIRFWASIPLIKDSSSLHNPTHAVAVPADIGKHHNSGQLHSSWSTNGYNKMSPMKQVNEQPFTHSSAFRG